MSELADFEKELSAVLNRHGLDAMCQLPDYFLAEMISTYLGTVKKITSYAKSETLNNPQTK